MKLRTATAHLLLLVLLACTARSALANDCAWPDWEKFRTHFIDVSGKVVDPSTPDGRSTSEGQSYGLFFALVANDRDSFARILQWTEQNLAEGDLTAHLPAWLWGKKDDGSWGVLDNNSASDSDLWIAYSLAEAGRLWKNTRYSALAELLAQRIVREETSQVPELGLTLLPGAQGFLPQADTVRLNPSYFPIQIMRRMASLYPKSEWRHLTTSAIDVIARASPNGYAPDWVLYQNKQGFRADTDTHANGSYNAIRVYLWAGMLADNEPVRRVFVKRFMPVTQAVEHNGVPPQHVNTQTGSITGAGPAGFSAALLPLLEATRKPKLVHQQRLRIQALEPTERNDNYYDQALTLFGLGWMENRYRFTRNGSLRPRWKCATR